MSYTTPAVLRVAVKDFRQSRIELAFLLLAVGFHTIAVCAPNVEFFSTVLLGFASFFALAAYAATLVQNDSPTNADSFWRAIPMSGQTVFFSKVLSFVAISATIFVIAEMIALSAYRVPMPTAAQFSMQALRIPLLLTAVLLQIAAIVPNFKTFVITALVVVVASGAISNIPGLQQLGGESVIAPWSSYLDIALGALPSIILYLLYTRAWSLRTARIVVATSVLVIPNVLPLISGLANKALDTDPRRGHALAASGYKAVVKENNIELSFVLPAPSEREQISAKSVVARMMLGGRAYRLGTMISQPGFESELSAKELKRSGGFGIATGKTIYDGAIVDGDSIRVTFSLRFDKSVRPLIVASQSPIELSGLIVFRELVRKFSLPANQPDSGIRKLGAGVSVFAVADSGLWIKVRNRQIGKSDSVSEAFLGERLVPLDQFLKSQGYSGSMLSDTSMLVSDIGGDTIRFRRYGDGARFESTAFPIALSGIGTLEINLKPDSASENVDLHEFVKHARLEYRGWQTTGYMRLNSQVLLRH